MYSALLRIWVVILAFGGSSLWAQDSTLSRLGTGDDVRGFEAVGRLDIAGVGFCTGSLISETQVLTAAHCLYAKSDGARIDAADITFQVGLRFGRPEAVRSVRRAIPHPDFVFLGTPGTDRIRNDVAILELSQPVRLSRVKPYLLDRHPRRGDEVGVVSYAHDRAEAPSLQDTCRVRSRQEGVLVMSCDVDFGSSGAPVFAFGPDGPRIVSVVSAKADMGGDKVSLGTGLLDQVADLQAALTTVPQDRALPTVRRLGNSSGSAKFVRP